MRTTELAIVSLLMASCVSGCASGLQTENASSAGSKTVSSASQLKTVNFGGHYSVQVPANFQVLQQSPQVALTGIVAPQIGEAKPRDGASLVLDKGSGDEAFSMKQMVDGEIGRLSDLKNVQQQPSTSLQLSGIPFERTNFTAQTSSGETVSGFVMLGKDGSDVVCASCGANPNSIYAEYEKIALSLKKQ